MRPTKIIVKGTAFVDPVQRQREEQFERQEGVSTSE